MNKIYLLTRMLLKNGSGENGKRNKKISSWSSKLFLIVMIAFATMMIVDFISGAYDFLSVIKQQGVIVSFGLSIATIAVFIFGLSYVLTTFYFTKDIDILLPLPLKSYELLSAKFVTVLVYEYLTTLIFLVPFLVVYGVKGSLGLVYWITAVLVFLILPIVPLVLASLLNMLIMRFTNLSKHKDLFRTIGTAFAYLIVIANLFYRSSESKLSQEEIMKMFAEGNNSLVGSLNSIFPTVKWASYSLIGTSNIEIALNLILFVLFSIVSVVIFMFAAKKLYFKGVVGGSESYAKRQKLDKKDVEKGIKQGSKIKAYTLKETKMLFRNPVFLVNCVIANFIWPIILAVGLFTNSDSSFSITMINSFFSNHEISGMVIGIGFGVMMLICSSNVIASTAISREGQNMYINKYIPMNYKEQILSKLYLSVIINMTSILLIIFILIFVIKISVIMAIILLIFGLLANIISSGFGIIIDINRPKLNWDNELKAVKQNSNTFISGVICWAISGLIIVLAVRFNPSLIILSASMVMFSLLIIIAIYYYIATKGQIAYSKIE